MLRKPLRRGACLLLLCLIGCMMLSVCAAAVGGATSYPARVEKYPTAFPDRTAASYPTIAVYTDTGKTIRGRLLGDTTYVAVRDMAEAYGATVSYHADTRCATVTLKGLTMTVTDGGYVIYANGRTLFTECPAVILSDGKLYAPIRPMAKAFGVSVIWNAATRSVSLRGPVRPLLRAEDYYRADDVYWLSRIISAESRGEPLLGQIAVGSVVLNRKSSRDYPSTVYGVIFDRRGGIQFTPAANGTVYGTPHPDSVLAAKICLEGYTVSDKVLFFLEPSKSTSSWVPRNRTYLFSIGHHDFYA